MFAVNRQTFVQVCRTFGAKSVLDDEEAEGVGTAVHFDDDGKIIAIAVYVQPDVNQAHKQPCRATYWAKGRCLRNLADEALRKAGL